MIRILLYLEVVFMTDVTKDVTKNNCYNLTDENLIQLYTVLYTKGDSKIRVPVKYIEQKLNCTVWKFLEAVKDLKEVYYLFYLIDSRQVDDKIIFNVTHTEEFDKYGSDVNAFQRRVKHFREPPNTEKKWMRGRVELPRSIYISKCPLPER